MDEKKKAEAEAAAKAKIEADAAAKKAAEQAEIDAEVAKEAAKDEEIKKLTEERDNYRTVALKRLGKLPADSKFLGEEGTEMTAIIEERVKAALIDKELEAKENARKANEAKLVRENAELRLALKNRPGTPIGGGGGESSEVKDNVFSADQLEALKVKAVRLKVDPEKFIESAKKNFLARR